MATALSHPNKLRPALQALATRRVDVAHVGDSNSLFGGQGWHWGWIYALGQRLGTARMYAGAVTDFSGGAGNFGGYDGANWSDIAFATGTHNVATTGAPAYYKARLSESVTGVDGRIAYYTDDAATNTTYGASVYYARFIGSAHYCNPASTACRWHISYGTSTAASAGAHQFRLCAFTNGGTAITVGNEIDPVTGSQGISYASIDYTTPATTEVRRLFPTRWLGGADDDRTIGGPVYFYFNRIEVPARTVGWSGSVLISMGGKGLREFAIGLGATDTETSRVSMDIEQLKLNIQNIVRLQTGAPTLIVRISSGFNDANPVTGAYLSVGGAGVASSTASGYIDNLRAIRARMLAAWNALGYDPSGLYFLVARSHSISTATTEHQLRLYHTAASDWAASTDNACAYDSAAVIRYDRIIANSWGSGDEHMTKLGYEQMSLIEVDALLSSTGRIGSLRTRARGQR